MAIVLTPEHERFIQSQIDAGQFSRYRIAPSASQDLERISDGRAYAQ